MGDALVVVGGWDGKQTLASVIMAHPAVFHGEIETVGVNGRSRVEDVVVTPRSCAAACATKNGLIGSDRWLSSLTWQ